MRNTLELTWPCSLHWTAWPGKGLTSSIVYSNFGRSCQGKPHCSIFHFKMMYAHINSLANSLAVTFQVSLQGVAKEKTYYKHAVDIWRHFESKHTIIMSVLSSKHLPAPIHIYQFNEMAVSKINSGALPVIKLFCNIMCYYGTVYCSCTLCCLLLCF